MCPFTNIKHKRYDHGDPPTDHTIIHISPHTWAITLKPFLFPSQHPYAPSDASAASVPLPIARPQPTTNTDTQIHESINSGPRQIRGEAISPPICMKQLPPAFEYLRKVYPTF
jgi:hypothetical protein